MNRSQETRLKKLEQVRSARPCRYVVYEDEYDDAIAKGLPLPRCFALMPRELSREDREVQPEAGWRVQVINDTVPVTWPRRPRGRLVLNNERREGQ